MIAAPDMTHAMLLAIQEVAHHGAAQTIEAEEALQRAEIISPKFAKWLKNGLLVIGLAAFTLLNNAAGIGSFFYTKVQAEMQRASK